ncbi:MAG: hypothetical protein WC599_06850 [Bacteroidales bacterium]
MNKYEELVKLFFRLNGYFLVDNFIIHNGNADLSNSKDKIIPQSTETDLLGIRMPFQNEKTGKLDIANYEKLILKNNLMDLVVVESKTGKENKPNPTWKDSSKIENIKYLVRFFGVTDKDEVIEKISNNLIKRYKYQWDNYSIRYIIVAEKKNKHYSDNGITYFTIEEILDFIIKTRGECWINTNMGIASHHQQWNAFMNKIFEIANMVVIAVERKKLIREYLNNSD